MELALNEGSDLEDFSDSGSEENIVDSGEEFVPVDLEADLRDGDNNIFIFIIGIRAGAFSLFLSIQKVRMEFKRFGSKYLVFSVAICMCVFTLASSDPL